LANPELGRGQPSETRLTRFDLWNLVKPGDEPVDVDGGDRGKVLERRFGQSTITTAPQAKGAYALRNGPLNPGPALIASLALD
jgi:hypothetical protein